MGTDQYAEPVGSLHHDIEFRLTADGNLEYEEKNLPAFSSISASPGLDLADGKWHVVSLVRKASGDVTLYNDGRQVGHGKLATSFPARDLVRMARSIRHFQGHFDNTFDGYIGPFRIYGFALTPEQMNSVVNASCKDEGIDVCDGSEIITDSHLYFNTFSHAPPST